MSLSYSRPTVSFILGGDRCPAGIPVVRLSPSQEAQAEKEAQAWANSKRNRKVDGRVSDSEINLEGIRAEMAVSWYLGGRRSSELKGRPSRRPPGSGPLDSGIDVVLSDGSRVQVKFRRENRPGDNWIFEPAHAPFTDIVDLIVLTVPKLDSEGRPDRRAICLLGWTTLAQYRKKRVPVPWKGAGGELGIPESDLDPMSELPQISGRSW